MRLTLERVRFAVQDRSRSCLVALAGLCLRSSNTALGDLNVDFNGHAEVLGRLLVLADLFRHYVHIPLIFCTPLTDSQVADFPREGTRGGRLGQPR